ncbi:MAG: DUF2029 domain-containing protein [Ktedonobacteraceae bacterium]|nr:DUF2029 domain-containing protein [Ktedonobacteraceae bacterium]
MAAGEKKGTSHYLIDVVVVALMGILMFMGSSAQIFRDHSDGARYQCYAIAFLHNTQFAESYLPSQCAYIFASDAQTYTNAQIAADLRKQGAPSFLVNFVASQDVSQPLHALPHEYPLLTLVPFLLVVFAPQHWYQVAFAILMILLAAGMYFLLAHFKSRKAAIVGAALLVIGGWATVAERFDLVPSLLTLVAVILAERKRWTWAFVLLALAFLMKFYPVILLLPFLLAQQMDVRVRWNAWRRWQPLAAFVGLCILVMTISFLLSVEGTIAPLSYFQTRPLQVESFGSSLIWLSTFVAYHPMTFEFTYGSLNVVHVYSTLVSRSETILEIVGLLYVAWLQWRRKIDLAVASLLTLLIVIVTGKIFSPQYLIWIVPLVAYVGGADWCWSVSWVAICGLTTFIYPYIYDMSSIVHVPLIPWFYPAVTLRNLILFGFVLALLVYCSHRKNDNKFSYHPAVHHEEKTECSQQDREE